MDLLTANGHIEPEIQRIDPKQSYAQPAQLFWNTGRGVKESGFVLMPAANCGPDLHKPLAARGSAYADIDNDGDLDFVITQLNGPARLFRNEQKLGHNWVRVKLRGPGRNKDAIGGVVAAASGKQGVRATGDAHPWISLTIRTAADDRPGECYEDR